jgi:hypothetical protein
MDAWKLPIALAVLTLVCIALGLMGADSRPGFDETKTSVKDRWFFHSKTD